MAVPAGGHASTAVADPKAPNTAFPDGPRQLLSAKALPVDLSLPEAKAFLVTETPNTLTLTHRASNSEIRVRFWSTSRLVTEAQCEQELRLQDPEAGPRERDTGALPAVASSSFNPSPGYSGGLDAKVKPQPEGSMIGYVHGVAAGLSHCLAFDAVTRIDHPKGEREMADRLTLLMDGIASSLRLRQVERAHEPAKAPFDSR